MCWRTGLSSPAAGGAATPPLPLGPFGRELPRGRRGVWGEREERGGVGGDGGEGGRGVGGGVVVEGVVGRAGGAGRGESGVGDATINN